MEFRRFLALHDKLLTVLGAFVIFATFINRENIGDRLKDARDSWRATQGVYFNTQNILSATTTDLSASAQMAAGFVEKMADQSVTGRMSLEEQLDVGTKYLFSEERIRDGLRNLQVADYKLSQLWPLTDGLPDARTRQAEIERLRKQAGALNARLRQLPIVSVGDSRKVRRAKFESVYPVLLSIASDEFDLSNRLQKAEREILGEVEGKKEKAEREYQSNRSESIILWIFGWALGLVGKFSGSRVDEAAE